MLLRLPLHAPWTALILTPSRFAGILALNARTKKRAFPTTEPCCTLEKPPPLLR